MYRTLKNTFKQNNANSLSNVSANINEPKQENSSIQNAFAILLIHGVIVLPKT